MFNIGFSELMLIGLVALVVIGPEKLPAVARTAGRWVGRMQRFIAGVKADLAQDFNLDELRQLKSEFEAQAVRMRTQMEGVQSRLESLRMEAQASVAGGIHPSGSTASGHAGAPYADALSYPGGLPYPDNLPFPGDLPIDDGLEGDAHLQLELPLPPPPPLPAMEPDGQLLLELEPAPVSAPDGLPPPAGTPMPALPASEVKPS